MIRIKIAKLLGENKMTRKDLAESADIRPATVSLLYDETIKRIDIDMLDRICKVLKCKVSDVLEYIDNDECEEIDEEKQMNELLTLIKDSIKNSHNKKTSD